MDDPHVPIAKPDQQLTPRVLAGPHVLLVLEDDLYARAVAGWLSKRGWRVTRAAQPAEALELWRSSGPDVTLVDLDDDLLGALSLLSAAQALNPPGRAVISTRDLCTAALPETMKRRLGIAEVTLRPCHIGVLGAALARTAGAAVRDGQRQTRRAS